VVGAHWPDVAAQVLHLAGKPITMRLRHVMVVKHYAGAGRGLTGTCVALSALRKLGFLGCHQAFSGVRLEPLAEEIGHHERGYGTEADFCGGEVRNFNASNPITTHCTVPSDLTAYRAR